MPDESTALFTDRYELTMLAAALADGTAERHCSFEVFGRRLPNGRRFGVVAGTGRLIEAIGDFTFTADQLAVLLETGAIDHRTADYLAGYRFSGRVEGYAEGEPYFPYSPILSVTGTFAEAVVLETLVLSVLNHDSAVAAAAARMVIAAGNRPIIEMGSRRTHEQAAVASARAAYLVGFASTSNLAAGARYAIPTAGTAAHAFTLLHDQEADAFASQVAALGVGTTLLVDTYDIGKGIDTAIAVAGPSLGAVRIDSGDLAVLAHQSRAQLDRLGATGTKIVVSGDLDEYSIAALAAAPVDSYGAGTAVVVGAGAPTAGLVYKLVEVDGRPVAKRSENKASRGGLKRAYRAHRASGTAIEERIAVNSGGYVAQADERPLTVALMVDGKAVDRPALAESRRHHRAAVSELPWEALKLSAGDPGLPVTFV
ncbi:nicotinate phosphoribosyltransferase [Jatrophihabitans telluris]|uniref:Nicotinate phosphoribosyltransferase n=1 Tax=Jatrophihabitans telluris TaxID=2038343 RepID=A0ABY4R1J6_9ACTN|nr:nicotinate phosphoribosyltransferase [Jatrophihabitans telluris]UQX89590.1 nicotinate phosphoribosyltransferase [Jatrophihabitans telluris]